MLQSNEDRLLTQADYAKLKGYSRQYVNKLVREKKLRIREIAGVKFILPE